MSTLEGYLSKPIGGAYQTQCMLMEAAVREEYREPEGDYKFTQSKLHYIVLPKELTSAGLAVKKINEKSERKSLETFVGKLVLDIEKVKLAMMCRLIPLPYARLGCTLLSTAGLSTVKFFMFEEYRTATEKKVSLHVEKYYEKHGDLSPLIESSSGQERYRKLFGQNQSVLSPDFDDMECKGIIEGSMIEALENADMNELLNQGRGLKEEGISVDSVDEIVVNINKKYLKARDKTNTKSKEIQSSSSEIQQGLEKLQSRVNEKKVIISKNEDEIKNNPNDTAKNKEKSKENKKLLDSSHRDVIFFQDFLYGKKKPEEQIAAIYSGLVPGITDEEKAIEQEKIDLVNKRKEFYKSIASYSKGAKDIIGIADNLKFKVKPEVRKAVTIGTTLIDASLKYANNDFLGAARMVSSLAGLNDKKVDIGAERHTQVITALGQLAQGQTYILGNQDKLLKWTVLANRQFDAVFNSLENFYKGMQVFIQHNIDTVIEGQKNIFSAIENINRNLKVHHETVMVQLAKITYDVAMVRFAVHAAVNEPILNCETAFEAMESEAGYIKDENRFQSYEQLVIYYQKYQTEIKNGLTELNTKLRHAGTMTDSNFFQLGNLFVDGEIAMQQKNAAIEHYRKLKKFTLGLFKNESDLNHLLFSLVLPVENVKNLDEKIDLLKHKELPERLKNILDRSRGVLHATVPSLLSELNSSEFVHMIVEFTYRFHYFFQYFTSGIGSKNLYTKERIIQMVNNGNHLSKKGKSLLEAAMVRTDITIAQQMLLSGDILLPKMVDLFVNGRHELNRNSYQLMIEILSEYYILAYNFMLYTFHQKAKDKLLEYMFAINTAGNSSRLRELFGEEWRFHWEEPHQWFLEIGNRKEGNGIPLPDPVTLNNGMLLQSPEIEKLLEARAKLVQEIVGYDFVNELSTPEEKKTYSQMVALKV